MSVSNTISELKSSSPKIGMKGFSLSSKSNQAKSFQIKNHPLEKRLQTRILCHEDSDSETDSDQRFGVEAITGFGENGAFKDGHQTRGLLVIKKLKNKDWKSEIRRRRSRKDLLPPEVRDENVKIDSGVKVNKEVGKKEGVDVINSNDGDVEWGLSIRKRAGTDDISRINKVETENDANSIKEDIADCRRKPQDLDEEALQALLGESKEAENSHLFIIAKEPPLRVGVLSEHEAYRRAIASAPEPSTLEDYERVPVEEFGPALLRGMGWNGEKVGSMKEVKPRQNLLGLGAKELKEAEELGAWVNKSDTKRLKSAGSERSDNSRQRLKPSEYKREEERRRRRRDERGSGNNRR